MKVFVVRGIFSWYSFLSVLIYGILSLWLLVRDSCKKTPASRLSVVTPVCCLWSEWSWLRWRLVAGNSLMRTLRLTPKPRILLEDFWLRAWAEDFSLSSPDWGLRVEYSLIIQLQIPQSLDHDRRWSWPLQRCQNGIFILYLRVLYFLGRFLYFYTGFLYFWAHMYEKPKEKYKQV